MKGIRQVRSGGIVIEENAKRCSEISSELNATAGDDEVLMAEDIAVYWFVFDHGSSPELLPLLK